MDQEIEEGARLRMQWGKLRDIAGQGLDVVPAVAQDVDTGAVVMVGYVNEDALREAFARKCAVFWSTSRNALWIKGATSGNTLALEEVRVNCEQNSLLYRVRVADGGGACHTRGPDGARFGCYYRRIEPDHCLTHAADGGRMATPP